MEGRTSSVTDNQQQQKVRWKTPGNNPTMGNDGHKASDKKQILSAECGNFDYDKDMESTADETTLRSASAASVKSSRSTSALSRASKLSSKTNWRSIYIASILSFVGSTQFSLYVSSLWPYLQIVDRSTTETFFGYIIAIYSLGQIFSSPTFGYWSNRIHQVRLPLYVGLLMMFIGNACYIVMEVLPFPKRYLLLLGRCVTGMGSGNVVLLRTYACTASTSKDRPKAIAYVTCGQALGMTSGPALQLLFSPLAYPGYRLPFGFTFNLYTAPAYLACAMNFFGAVALHFLFHEEYAGLGVDAPHQQQKSSKKQSCCVVVEGGKVTPGSQHPTHHSNRVSMVSTVSSSKLPPYDLVAVLVCHLTRFTQMFINTNLETIGSPFSMMMFAWTESRAVIFTSLAQGGIGLLTLLTYVIYIALRMEKIVNFRVSCIIALVALIIFHLVTYSWPFLHGHVATYNESNVWDLSIIDSDDEPVGCNAGKFAWCADLRPVNVYLYYAAYITIIGLAFPTLNITMMTLFSKVLGPRRQGTQQGMLQISGGVARMLGPVLMSSLYSAYGPTMAWNMEVIVIGLTLSLWAVFYTRMVPLRISPRESFTVNTQVCAVNSPMAQGKLSPPSICGNFSHQVYISHGGGDVIRKDTCNGTTVEQKK